ncbi:MULTISPECIES: glutamate-1-semialdehyde 2,1-aminomutase [Methanobacterium]|jgi:glutamate-1-semialdehyde 2,1-aminomutase|uniref:Glutamate-1-semialdehyde 2,1-aminomutase n=1 Tax=Methanobacterium subterraneum TaxID=59277 RepID=A0A2H4VMT8_9EURY|nr:MULTISPECIES: glutamate-1-semialdehyde 2,1-aminomutase [Methanobacterium]AUB58405.1 glutamate-1-semialdehyde-2,1-aminomutase [Methanobacterium sp. MZ-A1]AUB59404.1 glutamate-1-semialdehyde-2,1-aminomutase [Methanobacterium subterraneum]MBW4257072.1 glutamate-1-semialdehyde 2,1-aminomutase [Methanobacterium sp. YSL]NMO08946.1 glutamate-1-semialdehyde 2,1-aminomutase [Methanobacterium subterraneum]
MKSEDLFKEAKNYLPGGVDSPVRAIKPYPFFAIKGEGPRLFDVDGNSYLDYCLAYGPLVLGHAYPPVMEAVSKQLSMGTAYGVPTENEIKLAKEVVRRVPCAEMVRFVNSGTEATMSAIRLARAVTGKSKIVKFEGAYHGAHDYVLVKSGSGAFGLPDSPGVPEETTKNTLLVPFNDEEAITSLVGKEKEELAAIILEPVMGNVGCIPPKKGFLEFLRKITAENNIILIFDEVITGFRIAEGGAQEYFGVTPDLVTFGKILGGGFPIGALAGKREFMERIAPAGDVYQAGTFNGNPISITAGLETMKHLDKDFYQAMNVKGLEMRRGLENILEDASLNYPVAGLSSMFQIYFTDNEVWDYSQAKSADTEKFNSYFQTLLGSGVFIPPSQFECCFLSQAHSSEDIQKTLEAMEKGIKTL